MIPCEVIQLLIELPCIFKFIKNKTRMTQNGDCLFAWIQYCYLWTVRIFGASVVPAKAGIQKICFGTQVAMKIYILRSKQQRIPILAVSSRWELNAAVQTSSLSFDVYKSG